MHATVATPPCWRDAARLLSLSFHGSVFLSVVLSSAVSHPSVDACIAAAVAAAAVLIILSCSSLSFLSLLSGLPVQMRSSDYPLPSVFFTPPLSISIHVHYASSTFSQTLCDMQSSHVVHYIQCICILCTDHELRTVFKGFRAYV